MKTIEIISKKHKYSIYIQNNILQSLDDYIDKNRLYVIISDDNIPKIYIENVIKKCPNNIFISFPSGEKSKSLYEYERIIDIMQTHLVSRDACIIALGGGVTGDLSGFIASTYMRGIDYIQIPTTLLSQIDSSIGGKVAINTKKAKNSIGQFYPPKMVLIDPIILKTLSERQFNNGMAEMIKYGMIYSKLLFQKIENKDIKSNLEYYIYQSLLIKKYFVEKDEFDNSIRQILNFGHTFGHAYEAYYNYDKYLHGEAISLGMLKVCENIEIKKQLQKVLLKYNLPIKDNVSEEKLIPYIKKDKKIDNEKLNLIIVNKIGEAEIKKVSF